LPHGYCGLPSQHVSRVVRLHLLLTTSIIRGSYLQFAHWHSWTTTLSIRLLQFHWQTFVWHTAVSIDTFHKSANCFPMMQIVLSAWQVNSFLFLPSDTVRVAQTAGPARWMAWQTVCADQPTNRLTDWPTDTRWQFSLSSELRRRPHVGRAFGLLACQLSHN